MKRFFGFLLICAIGLGVLYYWWQHHATAVIQSEVQRIAHGFFTNPEALTVTNDPVRMVGLRAARVPKLVIAGKALELHDGPTLDRAKLVLKDVEVSGPPFHLTRIGSGYYVLQVSGEALTDFLHQRGGRLGSVVRVPLDTLDITFSRKAGAIVSGEMLVLGHHLPLRASGPLVTTDKPGVVNFRPVRFQASKYTAEIPQADKLLGFLNPVLDLSAWPMVSHIVAIDHHDGYVVLRGKITGARQGWSLPSLNVGNAIHRP